LFPRFDLWCFFNNRRGLSLLRGLSLHWFIFVFILSIFFLHWLIILGVLGLLGLGLKGFSLGVFISRGFLNGLLLNWLGSRLSLFLLLLQAKLSKESVALYG
jgi:hypothetical protein